MPAVLTADGLTLARGGRRVVSDVTFCVAAGEALLVTGPNGAGKSTLLRTLAGLLAPESGRVTFACEGVDPDDPPSVSTHYLGHSDALKSALSVRENLSFWAAMMGGRGVGASVEDALAAVRLERAIDLPVGWLSAGQKRRAALARLLVAQRPIWILDEPATALDAASQERLAALMARHRDQGGLIVAATHAPLGLAGAAELRLGEPG